MAGTKTREEVLELLRSERTAMVTTLDGDKMVSRPMAPMHVDEDTTLWFFTEVDADKTEQVEQNPTANVTFSHSDYLSVSGTATTVRDVAKQKELWNSAVATWMQCEPDDPKVALLKVVPDSIAYWTTPNSLGAMFEAAKAKLTDQQPDMGESGVIEV